MSMRRRLDRFRSLWANLHPLVKLLVLAALLAAAAYPTAKPAYRMFKQWRMERNLTAAGRAMDERRMQEARDLSLAVLRAGDPGIEAFRILERSTAWLNDPRHRDIARALIFHPEGTDDDRLTGFRAVVMDIPLGHLVQVWAGLPEHLRQRPEFVALFAKRLREENRLREAGDIIMAIPARQRDVTARQELARVLVASGRDDGFMEAQRMIATGIERDGAAAVNDWLEVFEKIPPYQLRVFLLTSVPGNLEVLEGVEEARRALIFARLAWADAITLEERARIIDEAVEQWSETGRNHLARFLKSMGEEDRLLRAIPAGVADADVELVRLMWNAALRMEAWDAAQAWLDGHGDMLPPFELAANRAILAARTGDSPASQLAWRSATDAAKQVPTGHALLALHRLASDAGFQEAATTAMIEAIRTGSGPLPLYENHRNLIQSLSESRREQLVLEICAIYLALEPWNPVLLTQYAYLASVHEIVDPERLLPPLEALSAAFPDELPVHATLATVLMSAGRPADAAAALERFNMGEIDLPPIFLIVHLACEVMNGRIAADDARITSFPWNQLQTADRRKFTNLIRGAAN